MGYTSDVENSNHIFPRLTILSPYIKDRTFGHLYALWVINFKFRIIRAASLQIFREYRTRVSVAVHNYRVFAIPSRLSSCGGIHPNLRGNEIIQKLYLVVIALFF